ncbi:MAG: M23 family metallopeptidase [Deltaproteobacteria bacterium]|nr:M23 family metallopeptidase [Deltaproteobacteria bacterium]
MSRLILPLLVFAVVLNGCAAVTGLRSPGESVDAALRRFRRPVDGRIVSGFGGRGDRQHKGVDMSAPEGTPVCAAESGFVFYAGDKWKGYGNAVALDHGGTITSLYGHLREIHVKSGDAVPAGAMIGTVGKTGNATTPHLHFEIRVGDGAVDPREYIKELEPTR